MKSRILFILLIVALMFTFVACNNVEIGKVSNISYLDGVITFDEVEGATAYDVVISHNGEAVYEDTIQDTAIDVTVLGVEGNLTLSVNAVVGEDKGEATS